MTQFKLDARIKFLQTIDLPGPTAIVSAAVVGGPIILLQVALFNRDDKIIDGVGFEGHGPAISSRETGTASWLFKTRSDAAYIKWGVIAVRSAGGLPGYSVTAKLRGTSGEPLAIGQFSAAIPDGVFSDDVVFDGVKFGNVGDPVPGGVAV